MYIYILCIHIYNLHVYIYYVMCIWHVGVGGHNAGLLGPGPIQGGGCLQGAAAAVYWHQ